MTFALDNNDVFRYKRRRSSEATHPYVNSYVTLFRIDRGAQEHQKQGQFIIAIAPSNGAATVTLYKAGAVPMLHFPLTRKIAWDYRSPVYCYINDQRGDQWLLQFADEQDAARATAAVALLLSAQSATDIASYEVPPTHRADGIALGDKVMLSFSAFSVTAFPYVGQIAATRTKHTTAVARNKIPTGWVSGILGMQCGATRTVYVPARYTCLEDGSRDPLFPNENLVIVTSLLRTKSATADEPTTTKAEEIVVEKPVEKAVEKTVDKPAEKTVVEKPVEKEEEAATKAVEEKQEMIVDEKQKRLSKIMRFGTPIMPTAVIPKVAQKSEPVVVPKAEPAVVQDEEPAFDQEADTCAGTEVSELDKMCVFENSALCGFASLLYQMKVLDDEMKEIRKEITSERTSKVISNTNDSLKQIERTRKETERLAGMNAKIERMIHDNEARIEKLRESNNSNEATAKGAAKAIIKSMMSDVFEDMNNMFDEDEMYTGEQVSAQLYNMLRKHSFSHLKRIEENGLF